MFSTPANKPLYAACRMLFGITALATVCVADEVVTAEITNNSITALAGNKDTIWMATNSGLNYTIVPDSAVADSFIWWGLKKQAPVGAIAFNHGRLLAGNSIESQTYNYNTLFQFTHANNQYTTFEPGWPLSRIPDELRSETFLYVNAITSVDSTFYLATIHGGLVLWNTTPSRRLVFYPGIDSSSSVLSSFPPPTITPFPDSNRAIWSLAVEKNPQDSNRICTMLSKKLWFFNLQGSTWDSSAISLSDPAAVVATCLHVFTVHDSTASSHLYATIATSHPGGSQPDTSLYRYNRATNTWTQFLANKYVHSLSGQNHRLYLITGNEICLYSDTAATEILPKSQFRQRIIASGDIPENCQFKDILLLPHSTGNEASLCIASSFGLFFSRTEYADELSRAPFIHLYRSQSIKSGLMETFAVPGIINAFNGPSTYFAYNLKKDGLVTIRILDWNKNPVKVIVKNAPRLAGSNRAEGRSTNMNEDIWDGTDRYGRHVPVGVYYYEIGSNQGERTFGKIVVAQK